MPIRFLSGDYNDAANVAYQAGAAVGAARRAAEERHFDMARQMQQQRVGLQLLGKGGQDWIQCCTGNHIVLVLFWSLKTGSAMA